MKKSFLLLALMLCGVCGCVHSYVMKLSNGARITTNHKPKLKGSSYHFTDPTGREQIIPQGRVLSIEPASMAAEENKFQAAAPKKKHWYWPF